MPVVVPRSIEEAIQHLTTDGARCIAGGQSLVAMMNAGLLTPAVLVSLRDIDELKMITCDDAGLAIGAMVPHAVMAAYQPTFAGAALLAETASKIGHPAIRNQGTIGGSVCHADPAADYPTALVCADAMMTIAGPSGKRQVPATEFFHGMFETAVESGELLTAIAVPRTPDGTRVHYEKFALIHGDFAAVSVASMIAMDDGVCSFARIAIGACGSAPVRVPEAEHVLIGSSLDEAAITHAANFLVAACDPIDDYRASAVYRLKLVPRLIRRAIDACVAKTERADA